MKRILTAVTALSLTALAGCAGFDAARPTDLYLLTPKSTFSSNLPSLNAQIVVEEPTASAAVNTDRIAVQPTPLQVQYIPGARWVDRAPSIVQTLLIESFENTKKVTAVGRSAVGIRPDYNIVPELREFQAMVTNPENPESPLQVDVRLNIKLVDAYEDHIIGSASFEAYALSPSAKAPDLVKTFDDALGKTMRDAVEWSIRRISEHARRTQQAYSQ
ncbi:ABC-type transport auxiliary lipoprotein family protein [Chachezhania sediminis]|uniref:ABC-type transport auxiliary lipoprotein family protein n=1 Tax=Chachezhania sediminis TaxID=2599291 RepID=UPI00131CB4D7|nr:ABC-type transport auxiliary lipoprotein family protein [Chachezhania sediminis]